MFLVNNIPMILFHTWSTWKRNWSNQAGNLYLHIYLFYYVIIYQDDLASTDVKQRNINILAFQASCSNIFIFILSIRGASVRVRIYIYINYCYYYKAFILEFLLTLSSTVHKLRSRLYLYPHTYAKRLTGFISR